MRESHVLESRYNRCAHGWCSGCRTRRGSNKGNRDTRRTVKAALRRLTRRNTPEE